MKRVAVLSAILENSVESQKEFNEIIAEFRGIVKGRMGIPLDEYEMSVITITVISEMDDINKLTGKLGQLEGVYVKSAISKKVIEEDE